MALQKTSPQNVFLDRGNSLAIYIDGKTGFLMLKDSNGQIQPVSDYISGASGNFIKNQKSVFQDANFKIAGIGIIGDTLLEQALNVRGFFSISDQSSNIIIHTQNFPPINQGAANISIGDNNILDANPLIQGNIIIGQNIMELSSSGSNNIAIGTSTLQINRGSTNIAIGSGALLLNTEGNNNIVLGDQGLMDNDSGTNNISIGTSTKSNNRSNVLILGSNAEATQDNQIVIGSTNSPLGIITTESASSDTTLQVNINGSDYLILMKAI